MMLKTVRGRPGALPKNKSRESEITPGTNSHIFSRATCMSSQGSLGFVSTSAHSWGWGAHRNPS